jgi:hypothetical protein
MAVGPLPTVKDFDGLVTKSYSVDSVSTRAFGSDVVVVTARVTVDRSYKDSTGNSSQTPSPIYTMTVWQRTGGKWVPIAHSETPVMSPQGKAGDGASPQSHD